MSTSETPTQFLFQKFQSCLMNKIDKIKKVMAEFYFTPIQGNLWLETMFGSENNVVHEQMTFGLIDTDSIRDIILPQIIITEEC